MSDSDEDAVIQANIKSGRRTMISGCVLALAGIIVPMVLFQFAGVESGFGWGTLLLFAVLTPVMVIRGIALSILGLTQARKAGRKRGSDSDARA